MAVADFCRLEPGIWAVKLTVPPVVAPEAIAAEKVAVLWPAGTVTLPGETVMFAAPPASTTTGPLYPAARPTATSIVTVPVGKLDPPEALADSTASRTLTFTVMEPVMDPEVAVNATVPSGAPAPAAMV